MDLLQLQYFRIAAQLQNFTRAADVLMIPQSAVSRTISNLEKELGCSLFDRVAKRVVLNARGRQFLHSVEAALHILDEGVQQLQSTASEQIKLCVKAGNKVIPSLLADFQRVYPHNRFVLKKYNDVNEPSDFYITTPSNNMGKHYLPLLTEPIKLAISTNHRLYEHEEISLNQLKDEQFIGFHKGRNMRIIVDEICLRHGYVLNMMCEADDAATFREMVEQQAGLAFVPSKMWSTKESVNVRTVRMKEEGFERTLILSWNHDEALSGAKAAFRDFAVEWFAKL